MASSNPTSQSPVHKKTVSETSEGFMKKITIAIDGFSACGKSTTAKKVASELGYDYIDSGAMYRAVTLYFIRHHVKLTNPKQVQKALEDINISFSHNPQNDTHVTFLNGLNIEQDIRQMEVSQKVSQVSTLKSVRDALVAQQRKLGKDHGVVMDGRDIGTIVFPDAELKIFMEAEFYVRAERRQQELLDKGNLIGLEKVMDNLRNRDTIDSNREESPLRKADDAVVVDTTHLTFEEQVDEILQLATTRITKQIGPNLSDSMKR